MASASEVRAYLSTLSNLGPNLVGVFVGGTSGIGESTAREFTRHTRAPHVYLVGRSREQADRLITEFKELNKEAQTHFIQSDVSLLRNVDEVCKEISAKEEKVNLLMLSAGIMTMKGRDETTEGLDKKLSLHYYSRLRFTTNLLPLLRAASSSQPPLARVIAVLGAGREGPINTSDFSLRNTGSYSLRAAASHTISMTSLSFDHLASDPANKGIAFIHSSPGGVDTNLSRGLGSVMQKVLSASMVLLKPSGLVVSAKESGERHVWTGTNEKFGSGLFLVGPRGQEEKDEAFGRLKSEGAGEKVWGHTEEVYKKVCDEGQRY
ncbi:short-chain dehydrogenase/reductase [Rhizodiscina lignyota]|uniref:Short-chain dehydrogenase/reductase n=1 Tax=Rhizodiscina lignyota TaxID=1504668 RepID=A0A9P4III8_9PEZI|nr:short-chain dehydrogenase/reductase [Rhizodiscina lignyota]